MNTETITIKIPSIDEVEFIVNAEEEWLAIKGNAIASGDDVFDKKVCKGIQFQLNLGNIWAWCCVSVTAKYKYFEATDYLGACSYKNKNDFIKNSGYYEDMKETAYNELIEQMKELAEPETV